MEKERNMECLLPAKNLERHFIHSTNMYSCSGCDLLLGIAGNKTNKQKSPTLMEFTFSSRKTDNKQV